MPWKNFYLYNILAVLCAVLGMTQLGHAQIFCPATEYDGAPHTKNHPHYPAHQLLNNQAPIMDGGRIVCRIITHVDGKNYIFQQEKGEINNKSFVINYHDKSVQIQHDINRGFVMDDPNNYYIFCQTDRYDRGEICWINYYQFSLGLTKRGDLFLAPILDNLGPDFIVYIKNPDQNPQMLKGFQKTGLSSAQVAFLLENITDESLINISYDGDKFLSPEFQLPGLKDIIVIMRKLHGLKN